jgi:hypothetical protein
LERLINVLKKAQMEAHEIHNNSYGNGWNLGLSFYTGSMLDNITVALHQAETVDKLMRRGAKYRG